MCLRKSFFIISVSKIADYLADGLMLQGHLEEDR
jgi:hypothetical protein